MTKLEDTFQERLERLEAGEPLERCATGLPAEERALLRLAAQLREVEYPAREGGVVATQRAELLSLARERVKTGSPRTEKGAGLSLPGWLRPWPAFAGALALLFICGLLAVIGVGFFGDDAPEAGLVVNPTPPITAPEEKAQKEIASAPTATPDVAPAATTQPVQDLYLPLVSGRRPWDPRTAKLNDPRGLVQVQAADGTWTTVVAGHPLQAGQRVRTGALSGVTLAFYDGSQAQLGPDTEVTVDELNAHESGGPRVVVLTQWVGETSHAVAAADRATSRYEVHTPTAVGTAKGTTFQVHVTADGTTHLGVGHGRVAVTALDVTVTVAAGQATAVNNGTPPDEPAFRITGEGEVSQIGTTWIIAGQPFETHDHTVIVGNPQVGDWVFVEGRLLPDDTRIADRILLLHRSPTNQFQITGPVEAIGDETWTVAGQSILVDEATEVDDDVEIGSRVRVEGVILAEGILLAREIRHIDAAPGLPFEFVGVVQTMGDESWVISEITVAVDDETEIDAGLVVGDIVRVRGRILEDGRWLATEIERAEGYEREFEISGEVESIDPWIVAGLSFETDEWTVIAPGIQVGDRVRVKGRILEDGTWLATEVERLEEDEPGVLQIVFVGEVQGIDPWVVSGLPLTADADTVVEGEIDVGDLVRVEVTILKDGTWLVTRVTLIDDEDSGLGCLQIVAVVVSVDGDQLRLRGWPIVDLGQGIPIEGELEPGSVVLLHVCVDADGTLEIVRIVVIYSPEPVIPPTPPAPPPPSPPEHGDKVTICHRPPGNPGAAHTITVDRAALQEHLNHGDTLGPCE